MLPHLIEGARIEVELANLSVLGFNFAVLPLLVGVFGWPVLLSQLVTVTVVYSWFTRRGWSFDRNAGDFGLSEHRRALS